MISALLRSSWFVTCVAAFVVMNYLPLCGQHLALFTETGMLKPTGKHIFTGVDEFYAA